jgi:hypothetical protein
VIQRRRRGRKTLNLVAVAALLLIGAERVSAQATTPSAGREALSGVWTNMNTPGTGPWAIDTFSEAPPPLTAWGQARFDASKPQRGPRGVPVAETDDLVYRCFPPGAPRIYLHPFPFEIIQTPGRIVILYEYDHLVRQIYTDGREHRTDLAPSWMGDSVGHWEGDTLVVETVNFNDRTWIDRRAVPHSEEMRLFETFSIDGDGNLAIEMRVEDPLALVEPWEFRRVYRKTDWTIDELVCMDNENYDTFENAVLEFNRDGE